MRFFALELSLSIVSKLRPLSVKILRHDARHARQLCDASASACLNLAEGSRRGGRDRQHHFNISAGEADEAQTNLRIAEARGYLTRTEIAEVLDDIDHLLAIIWKLTH